MQVIDTKGRLGQILNDISRRIPDAHLRKVCKKGCGSSACRYISLSGNGFVCVKNSSMSPSLDKLVKEGQFKAQGDNCEGFGKNGKEKGIENEGKKNS